MFHRLFHVNSPDYFDFRVFRQKGRDRLDYIFIEPAIKYAIFVNLDLKTSGVRIVFRASCKPVSQRIKDSSFPGKTGQS